MTELSEQPRTGIAAIDLEHVHLLEFESRLINFCANAARDGAHCGAEKLEQCNEAVTELFSEILVFMVEHFRHEEKLMAGLPADFVIGHRLAHSEISRSFSRLAYRDEQQPLLAMPDDLSRIIGAWLRDHIREWDLPLATLLHERGMASAEPLGAN